MELKNVKLFFCNPKARFRILNSRGFFMHLSDEKFLQFAYKKLVGKKLNLDNPKTFNEKLQWLKVNDRKPIYTKMVDKYEAKELVAELIGAEYVIPTLGVWEKFEDIDFENLPEQFVLKCTHDSGGLVICKNKQELDLNYVKKKINRSLSTNYFDGGREWPYKDVKPRIIAEKYMENIDGTEINDYKIQCFNGVADNILVCVERFSESGVKYHYFDKNWTYLPYCPYEGIDSENVNINKPETLDMMIKIAEKLSVGIPTLRVDLYEICGKIYFGEMTFFPCSGFDTTITKEADIKMGEKLNLNHVQGYK